MSPFLAHTRVLRGFPLAYRVRHQEVEPPFRASPRALVVRLPFRHALVIGWWCKTGLDEEGALAAIGIGGPEHSWARSRVGTQWEHDEDALYRKEAAAVGDAG